MAVLIGCRHVGLPDSSVDSSAGHTGRDSNTQDAGCWASLEMESFLACGLTHAGALICEQQLEYNGEWLSFDHGPGPWARVALGEVSWCATPGDGRWSCWGGTQRSRDVPDLDFRALDAGVSHACGITDADALTCWGEDWTSELTPPEVEVPREFQSTGGCSAVTDDAGVTHLWGEFCAHTEPISVAQVRLGTLQLCTLDAQGMTTCYATNASRLVTDVPELSFVDLAVDGGVGCGLTERGEVSCWGELEDSWVEPPDELLVSVDCNLAQCCGLMASGEMRCWGHTDRGEGPHALECPE